MSTHGRVDGHEDLLVWQLAMDIGVQVYELSRSFPAAERFGLTSQVRRAAVSIPSNIAEGHGRGSTREFLRFISIAIGSTAELKTQLKLARRLGFAETTAIDHTVHRLDELGKMLHGLRASLTRRIPCPLIPNP